MDFKTELDAKVAGSLITVTREQGGVVYTRGASRWLGGGCVGRWVSREPDCVLGALRRIDGELHCAVDIDHGRKPFWPWTPRVDTVTWAKVDTKAECAKALEASEAKQREQIGILRHDVRMEDERALDAVRSLSNAIARERDIREQALSALRVDIDAAIAREVERVLGERKGAGKAKGKGRK